MFRIFVKNTSMKNKYILSAIISLTQLGMSAQITSPGPYCAAGYDDGFMPVDHHISKVIIGTLNNNSGATQYTGAHYVYYNNLSAPNLIKNNTYTLSVSHDGGSTIHFLAAYIDFNKDNDFNDAGERVLQKTINDASAIPNPCNISIVVPTNAVSGTTRMRVMVFEDDDYTWTAGNTNATPCTTDATGFLDWGETEDYNVNISTTTEIEENSINASVIIFPNPTSNMMVIQKNEDFKISKITLLALNGDLFEIPVVTNNESVYDLSGFSCGIYLLEIKSDKGVLRKKIIKE